MTGGQYSPLTQEGGYATTAPYGVAERPFNISTLVEAAGATFVARGATSAPVQMEEYMVQGFAIKGLLYWKW
jgi:2-oxoglutarate/2-oxoacid ferredoxin oxidoreductase subunit beta